MRKGCVFQREFLGNDRTQRPIFEARSDRGVNFGALGFGGGPESKSANGGTPSHELAWINGDFTAIADDNGTPARGKQLQVGGEVDVGEHFENHVDATAAGIFQNFFGVLRLGVIESVMRAFFQDQVHAALCSRGAENSHAHRAGVLNSSDTDAATRAVNQQSFAGTGVRVVMQRGKAVP